ncbi:hypothetical protein CNMCM7691_001372 [Aspergillus felis]|uniref:tetrahydrofolate synthase n=1 Tax=Aspergillus felis TaxID=1287682 RepID=A0A8H6R068_9EURO|nr:hypothetical protein CNMCM7691_001372 [Aspergillus felis]
MQFSTIILLTAASLTAAMPFSSAEGSPSSLLNKRDSNLCSAPYPRFTEARLANIISEFQQSSGLLQLAKGQQGDLIRCYGGTGVYLSVNAESPLFSLKDLANDLSNGFRSCYGHTPNTAAGDTGYQPSFQYWGPGWNILRTGFPKKIGLYTGPHLQSIRERIQIDDHPVPEDLFTRYFFEVWDRIMPEDAKMDSGVRVAKQPRYLQFLALLAFHTFIREEVDAAIFEVHHGGEYDATNVIQSPVVTGITSLGMDHVAQLGPTIETIAWHKAGIFKPGAPAFSVTQDLGPAEVMRKRALDKGTTLTFVSANEFLPISGRTLSVPVQRLNCSLALELTKAFVRIKAPGHTLTDADISHGVENFQMIGRFEIIDEGQLQWFVDGAHNVLSLEQAAEWFARNAKNEYKCHTLIFSHLSAERDGATLVRCLAHALFKNKVKPGHVIFTTYQEKDDDPIDQSIKGSEPLLHLYASVWKELDPQAMVTTTPTIEGALRLAREIGVREDGMQVLVTGSLHMVGGALSVLRPSSPIDKLGL